ncbi:MAG: hypothetical protein GXC73_14235, partial [Chitinophagaceae bacterium]|nr:hypothetical protein [Chitinophagaceae bacterium]
MEVLHLLGHRHNWNLDSHYQNDIGSGFVFCAYSFKQEFFEKEKVNTYKMSDVLGKSLVDLQYFASKEGAVKEKGNLDSYSFHPVSNADSDKQTNILMLRCIKDGIKYQTDTLKLKNVIIPNYYENNDLRLYVGLVKEINKWLIKNRKDGVTYYMSLPIANHTIIEASKVEDIMYELTGAEICFDGYYVVCEQKPENGHKVSVDFKYLNNLTKVFEILNLQGFKIIYSYANWDAILFAAITNIDFITIGTYENLRNFNIRRFTEDEGMRLSKGWYFSEKILNFVKSPFIVD